MSILTFAIIVITGIATIFSSCKKEDDVENKLARGDEYAGGIIV